MSTTQYLFFPHNVEKTPSFISDQEFDRYTNANIDMYCISPTHVLTCLVDPQGLLPPNKLLQGYGGLFERLTGDVVIVNEGTTQYSTVEEFLSSLPSILEEDAKKRQRFISRLSGL